MGCQPSLLTLTVEPEIVLRTPGEAQSLSVRVMRRTPMEPITLRLSPPDGEFGIERQPVTVAADQDHATLTLRFSTAALPPSRTTIEIKAESSRNGLPIYGVASFRLESR